MGLNDEKLFRDPVHDLISFDQALEEDRVLLAAIGTPEVQRLRRIKQLGMAHMAYQGAEHSRFSHSIGVLHLLRRLMERLEKDHPVSADWRLATMCAGLLHDIGHGPFSHVMEKFFREHHETWSARVILDPETGINKVLRAHSAELPEMVVRVLSSETDPPWLHSLISSQMDVDRFDYLIRDAHMTGVKYGIFDLERLLMLLRVSPDGRRVVVSAKGLLPIEKYLQSRYQMYRQVYFHKTVTCAESMLMALLDRARDLAMETGRAPCIDPATPLGKLLSGKKLAVREFLRLDDSVILAAMNLWCDCEDPTLVDLSTRLLTRDLFKSVEIAMPDDEMDLLFSTRVMAARELLEKAGLDFRYYLRFSKSADTPYKPYSISRAGSVIWVQKADGTLVDVKEVSPTIKAFTESPYAIYRAFFPEMAGGRSIRAEMTAILTV